MNKPKLNGDSQAPNRTGFIHLAFSVGSKEQVDTLTRRMKADGWEVISGPRTTGDGYYESCVSGFEGNLIDINVCPKSAKAGSPEQGAAGVWKGQYQ